MTINSRPDALYEKTRLENKIAELEAKLQLIAQERANYLQRLKNEGYPNFEARTARQYDEGGINTPGQRKKECERSLAVAKAQLKEVDEALAKFAEQSIYKRTKPLKHGCIGSRNKIYPEGSYKISGTWLEMTDERGQTVQYSLLVDDQICSVINGILCVDDPESPYDGMSVADYTGLVIPLYRKEIERRRKEVREKVREYEATVREYEAAGKAKEVKSIKAPSQPMLRTGQLPSWPKGIRNFKRSAAQQ